MKSNNAFEKKKQLILKNKAFTVQECVWKNKTQQTDVTPFVILNIFISNCNLITHFFLSNCNWL